MSANSNSNKQLLAAYLAELHSDLTSKQKFKQRYQAKILELLINLEQANMGYDEVNRQNMRIKKQLASKVQEISVRDEKIAKIQDDLVESTYQIKSQLIQINNLKEQIGALNETIEQQKTKKEQNELKLKAIIQNNQNKYQNQATMTESKIKELQLAYTMANEAKVKLQQNIVELEKRNIQELRKKENQYKSRIDALKAQLSNNEKKLISDYENKLSLSNNELQNSILKFNEEKYALVKNAEGLESKIRNCERLLKQTQSDKNHYEKSHQELSKELKQKQKELKTLKKQNSDQNEKIADLSEQNDQLKSQLSISQQKRKQGQKRQSELKKQLEAVSQQHLTENEILNKQKQQIRDLKQELRKLKEEIQANQRKITQLSSNLYKNGIALEDEKKKMQEAQVRIEFIESANVKLNEKLGLEEKNRENVVKTIANEKDLTDKQNIKLLQLLQIKQNMIRAIIENIELEEPKLQNLGLEVKTREKWGNMMKQNLKDSSSRRASIDKWILN